MIGYSRRNLRRGQRDAEREHERGDAGFVLGEYGLAEGHRGGFIAKHDPQPRDIGLAPERRRAIYEAFLDNGCGRAA